MCRAAGAGGFDVHQFDAGTPLDEATVARARRWRGVEGVASGGERDSRAATAVARSTRENIDVKVLERDDHESTDAD